MTIDEAWEAADLTAFERMREAVGDSQSEGLGFRGYLPADGVDVWMFTSGGSGENTIYRLSGATPLYCSLWFNARVVCAYADRSAAMKWAGRVIKFLKDTNNLRNIGNVQELRLAALPAEPELVMQASGSQIWSITIPMEMIFATETTL